MWRSVRSEAWGDTVLGINRRSVPSCSIRSNLASARSKTALRRASSCPSKSRNGCRANSSSPRSVVRARSSAGLTEENVRSFSNSS